VVASEELLRFAGVLGVFWEKCVFRVVFLWLSCGEFVVACGVLTATFRF
jgi:hypothetical protein